MDQFLPIISIICLAGLSVISVPGCEGALLSGVHKRGLAEGAIAAKCPLDWTDSTCTCLPSLTTVTVRIQCTKATDVDGLWSLFHRSWSNTAYDWFALENSTLPTLPTGMFGNFSFSGFLLSNNYLGNFEDGAFSGSETSVGYLWMAFNKMVNFNFRSLVILRNLHTVTITNNNITAIPDGAFVGLEKLENVNLEQNEIETLGTKAFQDLPRLRRVSLAGNEISELPNGAFNLTATQEPITLILSSNKIEKIHKDAFVNPNIRVLDLENNRLQSLPEEVFGPILNSIYKIPGARLILKGNPISCDRSIQWLRRKSLDYKARVYGLRCHEKQSSEEPTAD